LGWILLGVFLADLAVFLVVIPLSLMAGQKLGGAAGGFIARFDAKPRARGYFP
jgi:hypothetical protein